MELISSFINILKIPKKGFFILALILAILLFSPDSFLEKISLLGFKNKFNIWLGVAFLLFTILSFFTIVELAYAWCKKYKLRKHKIIIHEKKIQEQKKQLEEAAEKESEKYNFNLKSLDKFEKAVLREFTLLERNTLACSLEDSTVIGLIKKQIIKQVGALGYTSNITGTVAHFEIDPRALEYYKSIDFNEINSIERPYWVNQLKAYEDLNKKLDELIRMH